MNHILETKLILEELIDCKPIGLARYYTKDDFVRTLEFFKKEKPIFNSKKVGMFNLACSFDIETTSFYDCGEKRAIMYEWTFCIEGYIFYGRFWTEFVDLINELSFFFTTNYYRRVVIYVHNLSFEFQFMCKLFEWEKVFAIDMRTPVYALTSNGIEFKCSYILSGYGLAKLSSQLLKYKVKKLVGDLDYTLIRHSYTPLSEKELGYCFNDVMVVVAYIKEKIESDGNITKIPLTKTGYVRRLCRDSCLYEEEKKHNQIPKIQGTNETTNTNS